MLNTITISSAETIFIIYNQIYVQPCSDDPRLATMGMNNFRKDKMTEMLRYHVDEKICGYGNVFSCISDGCKCRLVRSEKVLNIKH